jgi:hypothetical protein
LSGVAETCSNFPSKTRENGAAPAHARSEVRRNSGRGKIVAEVKTPRGCGKHCEN